MTQLFFKATNFISGRQLPVLQDVEPLIPIYENGCFGHWLLGSDSASLVDAVNGRLLTLQNGATVQPTYSDSGVTISTAVGNALLSDLTDTSSQDITMTAVVRCNVSALCILLGNLVPSNDVTESGLSAFVSSNKAYLTVKPTAASGASVNGISSLTPSASINQTSNFFIAISVNKSTRSGTIFISQNSTESSVNVTYSSPTYEDSVNKFAIGNSVYSSSNVISNTATFAEAIIFDKALTLTEIQAVATRSKERLSYRNIDF